MKNFCRIAMSDYEYSLRNMTSIKLEDIRYAYLRTVYGFIIPLDEALVRLENLDRYSDVADFEKLTLASFSHEAKNIFQNILQCESVEECKKQIDAFYTRVLVPVNGYLMSHTNTEVSFDYQYSYPAELSEADGIKNLLEKAGRALNTSRLKLNMFSMSGIDFQTRLGRLPDTTNYVVASKECFPNIQIDNYLYCESSGLYNKVQFHRYKQYLKKTVFGDISSVRMSMNFEAGIMDYDDYIAHYGFNSCIDSSLEGKLNIFSMHLAKGALEMIILPKVHLNGIFLETFSKLADNIRIFIGGKHNNFVLIMGNKAKRIKANREAVIRCMEQSVFNRDSEEEIRITCPPMQKILFRSSTPSAEEINSIKNEAADFINLFDKGVINSLALKSEEEIQHPLIPFSPGQLGLVLVSGKIDGVVTEPDGSAHVIKGSTYKTVTNTSSVEENGDMVDTITHSTGTSVALLTASGKYVELR